MGVELDAPADHLLVPLVRGDHVDLDDDRLVHCTRDDDAAALLAPTAVVLGLRLAHDRPPLAPRGTARAPLLRTETAWDALALLLRFGLDGRRLGCRLFSRRLLSRGPFRSGLLGHRFLDRRLLSRRLL